jgi:hypothetical protein
MGTFVLIAFNQNINYEKKVSTGTSATTINKTNNQYSPQTIELNKDHDI